ncbi:acyl transferase/acyl hydrolase/lysophospholipase [Fusarium oxysporum Fo47]|uniref:acyl transferase/acyl hydrolase/lysophospholipase n=1 Tax=Fusarium oxysporum Fo47 TaxID=660027 RepID=UPI0028698319|nr:acyl transferase/acyl hydrolase/lysophospholipase [Fusarium oxysporum Fo47]WJG37033.1 acyl transferase/acyl hydrolase/lysophospholipase [Fusarium oxysporum Fo47]
MSEHNPKPPSASLLDEEGICMLSLDGGGVRGLSSLYVLKRIMDGHNAKREKLRQSPQKPADIFDLIGGTSTGGLIAIMLGRLQMDVDECISAYNDLIKVVFSKEARVHQSKFNLLGQTQARFDSGGLKDAIEKTLRDRGLSPTDDMVDSREPGCKVFVCATSKLDAATYRFRSYTSHNSFLNATICQAARATSAATTFFNPVSIGGMKFVDGALGANNPVDQVEEEAREIWCSDTGNLQQLVKCFVSIGTGKLPTYNIHDRIDKFIATLAKMATDVEKTAEASMKRWRQHLDQGRYFRFNVDHGLQTVGMKEYKKKGEIQAATYKYLNSQVQSSSVQRCVENLILKKKLTGLDFELRIKAALPQDRHQRAALAGLHGSGKTQIAIQFAEWVHSAYPEYSVFWLSADNLEESYSRITQKLDLFRRYEHESKSSDARVLFHRYLSTEHLRRWFLIIDDADTDNYSLNPSAQPRSVFSNLPDSKEGNILFITHSMKAATTAVGNQVNKVIKVEGLENPDAISILRQSLFNRRLLADEDIAQELLSELNGLPLSIQQAARYLNNHAHLTIHKFLDLLRSPSQDAFPFISPESNGLGGGRDSQDSLLKTAMKLFEAIKKDNTHAGTLLEFISQIGPSSIPRTILAGTGIKGGKAELEESIGTLCSFFLLAPRQGGNMFDIPTVVHLCMRVWVKQKKASKGLTETVTKRLNERIPQVEWSKRLIWKKYEAHAIRVLTGCQDHNLNFDERFQLACKVGSWLLRERNVKGAIPWLQQTLGWARKSSFKNTQRRLRIQLDLAEAYAETEQSAKAIQLTEKASKFQEKHLSKDDSSALAVSYVLAKGHRFNGAPKKEIDHLEKLKKIDNKRSAMERLTLLGELGKCYSSAKEYEKAIENLEMGIDAAGSKIAKDDPILIFVKNHLAYAYGQRGQHNEAISILEETLPIQEQILGKSHSETLITQSHLANQYLETKELTKAISILEELVPIQRKTLGQMNRETMCSENQLAEAYFNNQNVYTALKLYEHMRLVRRNLGQSNEHRKWAEAGYEKCAETWKWTWMRR